MCVDAMPIGMSGMLHFLTIVLLSVSPLTVVIICLMYWGALMLGTYIGISDITSWIDPLMIM